MVKSLLIKHFFLSALVLSVFQQNLYSQIASLEATLKVEKVDGIFTPFQNGMPVPSFEKQIRQIIDLKEPGLSKDLMLMTI